MCALNSILPGMCFRKSDLHDICMCECDPTSGAPRPCPELGNMHLFTTAKQRYKEELVPIVGNVNAATPCSKLTLQASCLLASTGPCCIRQFEEPKSMKKLMGCGSGKQEILDLNRNYDHDLHLQHCGKHCHGMLSKHYLQGAAYDLQHVQVAGRWRLA